jgi:glycine/D-amino acid oxidase-like deaminating enzyme
MDSFDVVIVGGGVMGSAIAYFLRRAGGASVAVVERDPSYKRASSALSASSIRQQFSTPENIRMSLFGIRFLREIDAHLRVEDPVDVGLVEPGYLYLGDASHEAGFARNHAIQKAEGADIALIGRDELARRFPWLNGEGLTIGSLGLSGEGWFDGYGLMQAFRKKARALGAVSIAAEAKAFAIEKRRIASVTLSDGRRLQAGAVVNAGGPWARDVAALAGVPLPVEARRRCVFVVDARQRLERCPLVIDTSGVFFRPEGAFYIAGAEPPEADDTHELPLEVVHQQFDELVWPALASRVPAFEALKVVNAWAGYYEFNTFDQNAIVGPHPEIANFHFANGFSGHGIQQSPAVGRAIAELILEGRYTTLDLGVFAYDRIARGAPVIETNVIG